QWPRRPSSGRRPARPGTRPQRRRAAASRGRDGPACAESLVDRVPELFGKALDAPRGDARPQRLDLLFVPTALCVEGLLLDPVQQLAGAVVDFADTLAHKELPLRRTGTILGEPEQVERLHEAFLRAGGLHLGLQGGELFREEVALLLAVELQILVGFRHAGRPGREKRGVL